ncbi:uncharacterized protein LOC126977838 [Leptidea sinapis]|uniref:uncharacterized protein LOC126977838 n=1 Tax=Leptidea sinapis TaxID=189913 RepID=UPI00212240C0|nr:uncharacterized protein LOC126977838 [Leptidea sinapis]XP_050682438.1 uncharacterized protein LOC126977838 [Leptidea sinapis]
MLPEILSLTVFGLSVSSLMLIDYMLGNGFANIFQRLFCKIVCFVRRSIRAEEKVQLAGADEVISIPFLVTEIIFLGLTIMFLNKYKQLRCRDRIDDLLEESRDALRQTNDFLEKWRLRRVLNEYSYLDEEPQDLKPFKVEVPILHMAIVDTLGTSRSQPERGDAGDSMNITDSTLLSMTSLLDDEYNSTTEVSSEGRIDELVANKSSVEFRNRYLWDVVEEDVRNLDEN